MKNPLIFAVAMLAAALLMGLATPAAARPDQRLPLWALTQTAEPPPPPPSDTPVPTAPPPPTAVLPTSVPPTAAVPVEERVNGPHVDPTATPTLSPTAEPPTLLPTAEPPTPSPTLEPPTPSPALEPPTPTALPKPVVLPATGSSDHDLPTGLLSLIGIALFIGGFMLRERRGRQR